MKTQLSDSEDDDTNFAKKFASRLVGCSGAAAASGSSDPVGKARRAQVDNKVTPKKQKMMLQRLHERGRLQEAQGLHQVSATTAGSRRSMPTQVG